MLLLNSLNFLTFDMLQRASKGFHKNLACQVFAGFGQASNFIPGRRSVKARVGTRSRHCMSAGGFLGPAVKSGGEGWFLLKAQLQGELDFEFSVLNKLDQLIVFVCILLSCWTLCKGSVLTL